jgi:ATP-dependent Clp protease ATP-binding subunit ClpA
LKRNGAYAGVIQVQQLGYSQVRKRDMVDLGSYKDKFGDSGQRILEHALNESRRRDQNFVSVEHILQALTVEEPDMFNSAMRELSLDPIVVKMAI